MKQRNGRRLAANISMMCGGSLRQWALPILCLPMWWAWANPSQVDVGPAPEGVEATRVTYFDQINFCSVDPRVVEQALPKQIMTKIGSAELPDVRAFRETMSEPQLKAYAEQIAEEIIHIASCTKIDALAFAGLIGHESFYYKNNQSSTGAVGLGMLTGATRDEVRMQFGQYPDSNYNASKGVIQKWESMWDACFACLNSSCTPLVHWWDKSVSDERSYLKESSLLNLFYSAMSFRIKYNRSLSFKPQGTEDELLEKTLNLYNGSSAAQQVAHHNQTRAEMNEILAIANLTTQQTCYDPSRDIAAR